MRRPGGQRRWGQPTWPGSCQNRLFLVGQIRGDLAGGTLEEVIAATERGIARIQATHHLAFSFLRYCGLSLW